MQACVVVQPGSRFILNASLSRAGWRQAPPGPKFRPMQTLFDILIPLALLAVLITLCMGLYSLFRGGDFARSHSNKLMRLRVLLHRIKLPL